MRILIETQTTNQPQSNFECFIEYTNEAKESDLAPASVLKELVFKYDAISTIE